ncbi:MAG: hypothetical protein FJ038_11145 [Chloroflexi bacterium]|nr:hypothetical protein [Chloroflexota bacterium]
MPYLAYAIPILPGQSERAADFEGELTPELRAHYERLNREQNVRRHMEWVQPTPMGDVLIVVFESDTPERMYRPFEDNPYDNWWRARVRAIHGFDPGAPNIHPAEPRMVFEWTSAPG